MVSYQVISKQLGQSVKCYHYKPTVLPSIVLLTTNLINLCRTEDRLCEFIFYLLCFILFINEGYEEFKRGGTTRHSSPELQNLLFIFLSLSFSLPTSIVNSSYLTRFLLRYSSLYIYAKILGETFA